MVLNSFKIRAFLVFLDFSEYTNFKIGGQNGGGRYQQVDMTMTPPPANRLLNHHGSLSSADSSILYTGYFQ